MRRERKLLRAVVDTNLIISGTIRKRGMPFDLLEAWRAGSFILLLSEGQRKEVQQVFYRQEIQEKYALSLGELARVLQLLDRSSLRVSLRRRVPVEVRDAKDEVILAAALGGKADFLVTGDDDLLTLRDDPRLGKLKIVTAREFLDILSAQYLDGIASETDT